MLQTSTTADVARRMTDALVAKNLPGVLATMAHDIVLRIPGTRPLAGEFHGHQGILDFTRRSREVTDDGEHIQIIDILGGQDYAAVFMRLNATRGGRKLDDPTIHLLRIKDGKIAEYNLSPWDQRGTDAFWS